MGRGRTITTYVSIDMHEFWDEVTDDDLRSEMKSRNMALGTDEFFEELRSLLYRKDIHGALMLIERHNEPADRIENAYKAWLIERAKA